MAITKIGKLELDTKPIQEQTELLAVQGRIGEIDRQLKELSRLLDGREIATALAKMEQWENDRRTLVAQAETLKGEIAKKTATAGDAIGKVIALTNKTGEENRQQLRQTIQQLVQRLECVFTHDGRGINIINTAEIVLTLADNSRHNIKIVWNKRLKELVSFVDGEFAMATGE
jgi:hypothetical protein